MASRKRSAPLRASPISNDASQGKVMKASVQKLGACPPCRKSKVRCEMKDGAEACQRCVKNGSEDLCLPSEARTRPTRETSIPLSVNAPLNEAGGDQKLTRSARDPLPAGSRQPKRQRKSKSCDPESADDLSFQPAPSLDPVPEFDYNIQHDDGVGTFSFTQGAERSTTDFLSFLQNDESPSEENFEAELNQVTDSEEDGGHDNSPHDDSTADELDHKLAQLQKKKFPVTQTKKPAGKKSQAHAAVNARHSKMESIESEDDISQRPFDIQATVRQPDGTNSPFQFSSDISLLALRTRIAEKLRRYPDHVQLRYRLDCDKAKDGMISICNQEELDFFKERMRGLMGPRPQTKSKAPARPVKKFLVHFDDAGSSEDQSNGNKTTGNTGSRTASQSKQKASPAQASGQLGGGSRHQELVSELQERWKCKKHTKAPESPVYCYPGSSDACYTLSHSNLSLWALEIMSGDATMDEKPIKIILHDARSRSRTPAVPQAHEHSQSAPPYGYQPAPSPVIIMPPWGMPGPGYGGMGNAHPSHLFPPGQFGEQGHIPQTGFSRSARSPSPMPSSLGTRPPSPLPPTQPVNAAVEMPGIVEWFEALDRRENRTEPMFARLGKILQSKGFIRLSQLEFVNKYFTMSDLQEWLEIDIGTAVLIMMYVQEDLEAVRSGRQVLPGKDA